MLRTLHTQLRLYAGLVALGLLCLSWTLVGLPLRVFTRVEQSRRWGRYRIHRIFHLYLRILAAMGAVRLDITALDALRDVPGGLIVAPNHPSMLDAVLVVSRLPRTACLMKSALMKNIFLGTGAHLAGYIPNDPPRTMVREAIADLQRGGQLLLFPEGTRTVALPINPVQRTLGVIAHKAGVPVQTVFIETDSAFLGKGWPLWRAPRMPLTYRITLGRRFDPPADPDAFAGELDAYFRAALAGAMLPDLPVTAHSR